MKRCYPLNSAAVHHELKLMEKTFTFTVNGQSRSVTTDPDRPLLEVLREDLQLTGTKFGCGEGHCGACTVLIGGKTVVTCITPVANADQQTIQTVESLTTGDKLHPVQEAFLAEGALQCGYCIHQLVQTHKVAPSTIAVPTYKGKRGHPLLLSLHYRDEILNRFDSEGLRGSCWRTANTCRRLA